MKAVAVRPGVPNSVHMVDAPMPKVGDIPNGRGVLVKVLKVGVDATDKEINEAKYGNAPEGCDYLIIGHEVFGVVKEVGANVTHVKPGDYVTLTVRRPGGSIYDLIGTNDMTSESTYYERGINLRHGYMTEYVVDDAEFVVRMPPGLKHLHILAEPMSCAAKGISQAYEAQRRLKVWRPQKAYVLGVGQIGLLSALVLRLRGIEVYAFARSPAPTPNSKIIEALGAHYVSVKDMGPADVAKKYGKADLIMECTGSSAIAFGAMEMLGHNGALVWASVTGGQNKVEVPGDKINLDWVLGNKLLLGTVNGNRDHFEMGIKDLSQGELMYPGVMQQILTTPVRGLDNYQEMMRLLVEGKSLKVYMEIAEG
ncbi:MAG: glucose 1-dehydrogenase [Planctomycetes bacterium]|nr:glucose 1-dehydrogenase [Planctomycetota bacterium]